MLFICYFPQNQTQPTPPGDVVYPNTWGNSTNVNYGQEEKKEGKITLYESNIINELPLLYRKEIKTNEIIKFVCNMYVCI